MSVHINGPAQQEHQKKKMERPQLTFPPAEAEFVRSAYAEARVILEYGTGGSTVLCSELPDKTLFAVESDRNWLDRLKTFIDAAGTRSHIVFHYANVGPTVEWGYPADRTRDCDWAQYPLGIWKTPAFRQPDLVLIDGRFRAACFLAAAALTRAPVTVAIDDYVERPFYHIVEKVAKPSRIVGRLAVFELEPGMLDASLLLDQIAAFLDPR